MQLPVHLKVLVFFSSFLIVLMTSFATQNIIKRGFINEPQQLISPQISLPHFSYKSITAVSPDTSSISGFILFK